MTRVYHTYADADTLRDYLAGSTYASSWTADADVALTFLERASRTIDAYVGSGTFGPTVETRAYDLGATDLRYDPRPYARSVGIATVEHRVSAVPLDRWLVEATTVTAYKDSARTSSETLTAGLANDYLLEPYNDAPKLRLKLTENTVKAFGSGQQVLTIAGTWGWEDVSHTSGALDGAIASATATTAVVTVVGTLAPGVTIRVDSEQMYVTAVTTASKTLTVKRGVNGTTAATHATAATVEHIDYPEDVRIACLEIARAQYRDRDLGVVETVGTTEQNVGTRSAKQIADTLRTLDHYRAYMSAGGLVF